MDHQLIRRVGTIVLAWLWYQWFLFRLWVLILKARKDGSHFSVFHCNQVNFIKPAFVIVSAWLISHRKQNADTPGYILSAGLYVLVVTLLFAQPDFGMTIVLTCMFIAQAFWQGCPSAILSC